MVIDMYIFSRNKDGEIQATIIIDDIDYEYYSKWKWYVNNHGYACRTLHRRGQTPEFTTLYLHRHIMNLENGDPRQIDHINRNRADNRRGNLRIVDSNAHNHQNLSSHKDSTSKYRGVSWCKASKKWRSTVVLNGKQHSLGNYDNEIEAAYAADSFRKDYMPFSQVDPELIK